MKIGVVIPAFNEEARLPKTLAALAQSIALKKFPGLEVVDILVMDDGSADQTAKIGATPPARAVSFVRNRGKGAAVREGIRASRGEWVLIADADQSTPWDELNRLGEAARANPAAKILIGSRGLGASRLTRRQSPLREGLGKLFNHFIVSLTGLPFKDTQCGFKLVHRASVYPWLDELEVDRFAWDVEFLMSSSRHQLPIVEVPVSWHHEDGSKVRLFRDGFRMVFDFLKIRVRLKLKSLKI